jgi:hypothetical protein
MGGAFVGDVAGICGEGDDLWTRDPDYNLKVVYPGFLVWRQLVWGLITTLKLYLWTLYLYLRILGILGLKGTGLQLRGYMPGILAWVLGICIYNLEVVCLVPGFWFPGFGSGGLGAGVWGLGLGLGAVVLGLGPGVGIPWPWGPGYNFEVVFPPS